MVNFNYLIGTSSSIVDECTSPSNLRWITLRSLSYQLGKLNEVQPPIPISIISLDHPVGFIMQMRSKEVMRFTAVQELLQFLDRNESAGVSVQ